jgi:hypothetical protein
MNQAGNHAAGFCRRRLQYPACRQYNNRELQDHHSFRRKAMSKQTAKQIYQLKITLERSQPPIWRRLQVPGDITLANLHHVIQHAMGWEDSHLHHFLAGGREFGVPNRDWDEGEVEDERKIRLEQVADQAKAKIVYEYDFGDSWRHLIVVEKILLSEPATAYPVCLEGARSCPPEDCGGVWGYQELLEKISNPKHSEHDEMLEWLGGEFDPEHFSVEEVNQRMVRKKIKV